MKMNLEHPPGIIFEPGSCNMCGEPRGSVPVCQTLCEKCKNDPNVITNASEIVKELAKDPLLKVIIESPYK